MRVEALELELQQELQRFASQFAERILEDVIARFARGPGRLPVSAIARRSVQQALSRAARWAATRLAQT